MKRRILAVLAGYGAIFVTVMVTFTLAYTAIGADRAFRSGSYEPSGLWLVISFALSFGAALLGGFVATAIGRDSRAAKALVAVVIVLGILVAIPTLTSLPEPGPRTGAVPNLEAMQKTKQPAWVALLNPLVGAVGVLLGARLRSRPAA